MPFAQMPDDPVWKKIVEIAEKSALWIPGTLMENETVFNENGKVEETTERQIQFFLTGSGAIGAKLIKTKLNGRDITSEDQKRFESDSNKNEYLQEDESETPFAPHVQKNISVTRLPETQVVDSTECVVFQYRQRAEGADWQGTAWLDKSTGIPLKIHFKTDKSFTEEGVKIKNFSGTICYKHDDPEAWYPLVIVYQMKIETKVLAFFTFKGQVKSEIILSDYFSVAQEVLEP